MNNDSESVNLLDALKEVTEDYSKVDMLLSTLEQEVTAFFGTLKLSM